MKKTLLLAGLLAPWLLAAQMKLFVVEEGVERAAGEACVVGTVPAGEQVDTTFRVRNSSTAKALLHGLNVAGYRFSFVSLPKLPVELEAGAALEFVVRFQPDIPGSYSAYLNINGVRHSILLGTASPAVLLTLEDGTVLGAAQSIDFGSVEPGSRTVRRFRLSNPSQQELMVETLKVDGAWFRGPFGVQTPLTLKPGSFAAFEVAFEPLAAGPGYGTLELEQRSFPLRGTAAEPVFPKPRILLETLTPQGGQQAKVSVRLESPSPASGSGELSMEFTASVPGKGTDPAVMFPLTGSRSVAFTVSRDLDTVRFGDRAEVEFQTGTTSGTIVFSARLGSHFEQTTVTVPPAPVKVDSVRVTRAAESLDVRVTGFDTSRSASLFSFTFFDREGCAVAPGAIRADAAAAFRQYFETADFGGMFTLRAVFPVTGNVLQITAVEVEVTNSFGVTSHPRTGIQ